MKLKLISFALCPYVQRSVIILKYKKRPFDVESIDLESPPAWFEKISPLGQVPVLLIGEEGRQEAIFESAVINELVDETTPPPLHPADPVQRAKERAWIEYGSSLFRESFEMMTATEESELQAGLTEVFDGLRRLEPVLADGGPYFRGKAFSLVDAAYAPLFMRLLLAKAFKTDVRWRELPKARAWAEALLEVPAVKDSVLPTFNQDWLKWAKEHGSLLYKEN